MFEAFRIGVKISLINNASLGLAALSKDFLKTEAHASRLQKQIESIEKQAKKGALMLGMSAAIGGALKGPYEEAKKLRMEQEKFETLNLSAADNVKAFATAQTLAHKNLGSTIADNIALIRDLHTAVGDLPKALAMSEDYQKFAIAAKIQNGGKNVDGLVYNSIKALEHRGDRVMQDPAQRQRELAMQSQVYFGSGGKVSPNDYFHASQTGKIAYQLASAEYLYGAFAALISQKTGSTAGTTLMTFDSSLIGGHMDKKAKGFLSGLGLWETKISPEAVAIQRAIDAQTRHDPELRKALKAQHVETPVTGGLSAANAALAASNPDKFIHDVLEPAIRAKYGDMDPEKMALLVAANFNRATGDFIGTNITSGQKNAKDTVIFRGAKDFSGAYNQYIKSPEGAEVAAEAAWKNFLAVFGSVYLPQITKGLLNLASGLDWLGQFVERHHTMFKTLADGLLLLAVGLAINGAVLVLTAALRGLGLALAMNMLGGTLGIVLKAKAIAGFGATLFRVGGQAARALAITGDGLVFLKGAAFIATGPLGLLATGLRVTLVAALGALSAPVAIAVAALGLLVGAIYAFRPIGQSEADSYKDHGGAKLTSDKPGHATLADIDSQSRYVKARADRPMKVESALYLTESGKKAIANSTADHIATGILNPYAAGSFDSHLAQQTPGQGY